MEGFCPLASGSKGNCLYLGTKKTKVLIDAGISAKKVIEKLNNLNVSIEDIDAILVTHEHTDHIQSVYTLASRYGIPVFANSDTAKGMVEYFRDCPKFKIFTTGETFQFGDFEFHPFSIQHDTLDPVAFTVRLDSLKLGFCTDLGFVTSLVRHSLKNCDYLVLEANHEPSMVHASSRPLIYKQRVLGRTGHLSNQSAGELLHEIYHHDLKRVYLAHLSSECNNPETALQIVKSHLPHFQLDIRVAPQDRLSDPVLF